ncbi:unnamed protein product [Fusarium venenatum]|uniref:Uncharacterized protein n=1 Tax=Fusarium venenatum TaxID=56646 RepID=A0A2L2TRB9_9HYPO|nr:uncharacterized protein FVRRES_08668 [Fusarium venenatum]CEI68591.1 unnamed protein product [Fusarium venenatum]
MPTKKQWIITGVVATIIIWGIYSTYRRCKAEEKEAKKKGAKKEQVMVDDDSVSSLELTVLSPRCEPSSG